MKLILRLLVFIVFTVPGTKCFSQTSRLNLDLKNVTLQYAISSIEDQSDFLFLYSPKMINVNQKVNIQASGQTITTVLNELFSGTGINYSIRDRQILLVNSEIDVTTLIQKNRITGTVTDHKGSSLTGVTVVVKGTTNGTLTGPDGKYALNNVPRNSTLIFTFVGMAISGN